MHAYSMLLEGEFDLAVELVVGPEESDSEPALQRVFFEVAQQFKEFDPSATAGESFAKAANSSTWLNGDFVFHVAEAAVFVRLAAKPFVPVLTAWLKGRAGRKVRLKRGNIEVEAHTVEDAVRAWKAITQTDEKPS